jgi:RNA polymerase sigma-70 factor (ECF subfamily)
LQGLKLSPAEPHPSPEILAASFDRCVSAFEAEFDYVYHALRRHGVPDSDLEDLVQEVFLVMWRRWSQYDPTRPVRPWLAGISFRVAYNHRQRARREVPRGFVDLEDPQPDPEQSIASDSARMLVRRVLASLPEKHRTLIVSHDVDGISVREIAEALDVPIPTAHTRLRAARKAFAKALKRLQMVSATRARLAPLLQHEAAGEAAAALEPEKRTSPPAAPAGARKRAVDRSRAVALLPTFGLEGTGLEASGVHPELRIGPAGAWKGWLPVAGASLAGAGLLAFLALGNPVTPAAGAVAQPVKPPGHVQTRLLPAPARLTGTPVFTALPAAGLPPPPPDTMPGGETASLSRGLVGYWRFDDGYGSLTARDLSGNGNDCQLRRLDPSLAWTEGRLGGAVSLQGTGWLECPRVEALARLSREITISLWVRRGGTAAHVRALVSRQFGTGAEDTFHFGFKDDQLWMRSRIKGGPTHAFAPRPRGLWFHAAATVDVAGTARIYINGEEVKRNLKEGRPSLGGGTNPMIIGGGINTPDDFVREVFQGALDELLIYDRALSADEMVSLANGQQPRLSP